jgi:hypothetical protein
MAFRSILRVSKQIKRRLLDAVFPAGGRCISAPARTNLQTAAQSRLRHHSIVATTFPCRAPGDYHHNGIFANPSPNAAALGQPIPTSQRRLNPKTRADRGAEEMVFDIAETKGDCALHFRDGSHARLCKSDA